MTNFDKALEEFKKIYDSFYEDCENLYREVDEKDKKDFARNVYERSKYLSDNIRIQNWKINKKQKQNNKSIS